MIEPLNHLIVIQQINFVERVHQNLQTHPEISKLQSEVVDQAKREQAKRRTQALHRTERSRIILPGETRRPPGRRGTKRESYGSIDFKV